MALVYEIEGIYRRLALLLSSDSPGCCAFANKTVQERRKDGRQDYSQDPYRLGVYSWRAGNNHEAGKSDQSRHATHRKSNKHADDNLLHDIPFSLQPSKYSKRSSDFASHKFRLSPTKLQLPFLAFNYAYR